MAAIGTKFGLGSAGLFITDPKKLLKGKAATVSIVDSAGTPRADTTSEFWTAGIAPQGVQADTDFTADTYKDLLDISDGAGIIGNVLGPTAGGSETTTFRITRDGVATEIAVAVDSGDRAVLGSLWVNAAFSPSSTFGLTAYSVMSNNNTQFDWPGISMASILYLMSQNWAALEYTLSLKVEVKHSTNITGTGSQERRSGLTYYDGFQ